MLCWLSGRAEELAVAAAGAVLVELEGQGRHGAEAVAAEGGRLAGAPVGHHGPAGREDVVQVGLVLGLELVGNGLAEGGGHEVLVESLLGDAAGTILGDAGPVGLEIVGARAGGLGRERVQLADRGSHHYSSREEQRDEDDGAIDQAESGMTRQEPSRKGSVRSAFQHGAGRGCRPRGGGAVNERSALARVVVRAGS
jgi:hypothetical protein